MPVADVRSCLPFPNLAEVDSSHVYASRPNTFFLVFFSTGIFPTQGFIYNRPLMGVNSAPIFIDSGVPQSPSCRLVDLGVFGDFTHPKLANTITKICILKTLTLRR